MVFRNGTVSPLKTQEKLGRNHGNTAKKNPAPFVGAGFQIGSPSRTRTSDPVVNSHLLYRLSYHGKVINLVALRLLGRLLRQCL